MQTWTSQELDEFCKQAVDLLNKKKNLQITFENCWLFSNSVGSNFHIIYKNEFLNQTFEINRNGSVLQDKNIGIDTIAGLLKITDIKQKIILRLAYYIYHDCKKHMETK